MMREAYYKREQVAYRDLGTTEISPRVAGWLVGLFLASVGLTPLVDLFGLWSHPVGFDATELAKNVPQDQTLWGQVIGTNDYLANRGASIEQQMSTQLWPVDFFQPLQPALVRWIGLNTRSVIPGLDQSLFYKPDIDHLVGAGFLDSTSPRTAVRHTDRRVGEQDGSGRGQAPIKVILDFQRQLAERGIELVLLPVPAKPAIHPESLSRRFAGGIEQPLENSSFARFRDTLEDAGVAVLDVASPLLQIAQTESRSAYLKTDTHWTPESVIHIAEWLADWIDHHGPKLTLSQSFESASKTHEGRGDLAVILSGQRGSHWYPPEQVELRQVATADGQPWRPEKAEILLLGDSFTNIFSMPELDFGESAGLSEQLSLTLQRPVDRIAQNNNGAIATRRALARMLVQNPQRFAQTKLIIWQFAARELSFGNWQPIELPKLHAMDRIETPDPPGLDQLTESGKTVDVSIVSTGTLAAPGQVPYPDALLALEAVIQADDSAAEPVRGVVYVWGMRNNQRQPAARLRPGQRVKLRLTAWSEVEDRLERFARAELDDPDFELLELPVFFGELLE